MNALLNMGKNIYLSPKPRRKSLDIIRETLFNIKKNEKSVTIIGLCGGSSSGKSKIAAYYQKNISMSEVIAEKAFFRVNRKTRKLSAIDEPLIGDADNYPQERKVFITELSNPLSYNHDLLIELLEKLRKGQKVKVPTFDDDTNTITEDNKEIDPKRTRVIILEGSFILYNQTIRDMLDLKIYSEIDDDVRLSRLILKENNYLKNRPNAIKTFFLIYKKYLKPSYENYVESCKMYANIIFPNYVTNEKGDILEDYFI